LSNFRPETRKGEAPLVKIENLKVYYFLKAGPVIRAVDNVSLDIYRGEVLGLAGESGCGKSTLAYAIMKIVPKPGQIVDGRIIIDGIDIVKVSDRYMSKHVRWRLVSMVFQGAMNALNPVFRVEDQIAEAIMLHEKNITKEEAIERARDLLEMVGIERSRGRSYPHELSGGMRQRAMIAMALACNPKMVIADEPTTALDVVIQSQVMKLLRELRDKYKLTVLLITHDLSVIAEICDRVAIMYAGKIVELADIKTIFKNPYHPYTAGLMSAFPSIVGPKRRIKGIPGFPPDLRNPPPGCRFHPRCPYAQEICKSKEPEFREIKDGHFVACHFAEELGGKVIEW